MSRESLILVVGIIITATPYLGIPSDWKRIVYLALGIMLVLVGYSLRRSAFFRSIETTKGERRTEAFVENKLPADTLS